MLSNAAPLSEWLAWLETLSPKEINLGLERVNLLLQRLDLEPPTHVLLIAGTNGKGSSVAMSTALLRAAGHRVGAYTSPHITHYNERIVVDGRVASDAEIIAAFVKVDAVRGDTELTYFEFGTLAAAVIFADAQLDVWVLEVGLGGRLDATNAIEPTASLISNVALDHCDWLGYDVETIGLEKAGVMRAGKPTVFGSSEMPESVRRHAQQIGASLRSPGNGFDFTVATDGSWTWTSPDRTLGPLRPPGLLGRFQIGNAAAVLALLEAADLMANIDRELVDKVLPHLSVPGRAQRVVALGREWLIDVAHNPAAAAVLGSTLAEQGQPRTSMAIVGMLDDKDVDGVIGALAGNVGQWVAMRAVSHRAVPADELARQVANRCNKACYIAESAQAAIEFARRNTSENDRILVTGSFFTVGPILDQLQSNPRPNQ
jgi:dihydrofolate synthase/folylpolyglutamate synthase